MLYVHTYVGTYIATSYKTMHGYNLLQQYREYQDKLETESKRLKLEIEQWRESSKVLTYSYVYHTVH